MMYLKTRPAWAQLLMFIGLAFGSFVVISLVGSLILAKMTGLNFADLADPSKWDYTNPALLTFVRGSLLIQFVSLFTLPCLLFAYFSDPRPVSYLGLKPAKPMYFLLGVAALIFALPFVDWMGTINHQLIPETTAIGKWMKGSEELAQQQIGFMLKKNTIKDLLLNLIFIAVFAGVGEELFFRGVLQRIFIKIFKSPWAGIIATAFIFSAIHLQFYGFIPRLILGILLGAIYWYSGSLWPAILAHFVYDGFAVVMIYFYPSMADQESATVPIGNKLVMGILSAVVVTGIVYFMKRKSTASYEAIYAGDKIDHSNPFTT